MVNIILNSIINTSFNIYSIYTTYTIYIISHQLSLSYKLNYTLSTHCTSQCSHKQAELTQCGRRTLLCRTLNRDATVLDNFCYNCTLHDKKEMTDSKWKREVSKAEELYWYVKGVGGAVGMRSGDYWRL
ncbi:hypothetical protein TWF225_000555 [Orbilia oligospora]|nr:hypothetical protein TWF225_000555 [Orbilia oligospora]KAF3268414.1 hypothetical protein TWF217_011003 [Orbilia oligospora]